MRWSFNVFELDIYGFCVLPKPAAPHHANAYLESSSHNSCNKKVDISGMTHCITTAAL